jgi:hypothetical protein
MFGAPPAPAGGGFGQQQQYGQQQQQPPQQQRPPAVQYQRQLQSLYDMGPTDDEQRQSKRLVAVHGLNRS